MSVAWNVHFGAALLFEAFVSRRRSSGICRINRLGFQTSWFDSQLGPDCVLDDVVKRDDYWSPVKAVMSFTRDTAGVEVPGSALLSSPRLLGVTALPFAVFSDLCCVRVCWLGAVLCSSGIWFWEVLSFSWPPIQHSPQQGEEESRAESHWSTVFLLVARSVPVPPLSIMILTYTYRG